MPKSDTPKVKKKPGNPGDFRGAREDFLMSRLEEYVTASKTKKTPDFWPGLFKDYWARFHWTLTLKQEPADTDVYPSDDALTDAQKEAKAATQTKMKRVWAAPVAARALC